MSSAIPEVEITGQIHLLGSGCPLTEVPAVVGAVEAVEHMTVGKLLQRFAFLQNALSGVFQIAHTLFQVTSERCQTLIIFNDF